MKKVIIIVVLVVILILGVIGGLSMFGMGPFPNLLTSLKSEEKAAPAEQPVAAESRDRVYDLGTFIIPLVAKHAIGRQIGMDLAIVVDVESAGKVAAELPRLQNALLVDLYDFVPQHADAHSAGDREAIHQRLIKVACRLFGEKAIHDVVIKSLYDR
ncbi:hypothetical protein [Telmatospirillum siberiense]|uniref:Flagellar protein FliL n=1 Tax=Telmatospirillum siberiense TaxID=382514 RepID=A0A2N3PYT4_9PROT|nr:hypothetical protein [Telmatospirillum siberiense]PKU25560.1 hypothetical protein CWS72_05720 [Telmatospirillum siberiense]